MNTSPVSCSYIFNEEGKAAGEGGAKIIAGELSEKETVGGFQRIVVATQVTE